MKVFMFCLSCEDGVLLKITVEESNLRVDPIKQAVKFRCPPKYPLPCRPQPTHCLTPYTHKTKPVFIAYVTHQCKICNDGVVCGGNTQHSTVSQCCEHIRVSPCRQSGVPWDAVLWLPGLGWRVTQADGHC